MARATAVMVSVSSPASAGHMASKLSPEIAAAWAAGPPRRQCNTAARSSASSTPLPAPLWPEGGGGVDTRCIQAAQTGANAGHDGTEITVALW